jgi:hypothetical protein
MTASLGSFWKGNRAVALVAVAQFFGAVMNVAARLLEEEGMHPLQILFSRMTMTTLMACLYMWWYEVPDFPLGAKAMRFALVVRGATGFVSTPCVCLSIRLPTRNSLASTECGIP